MSFNLKTRVEGCFLGQAKSGSSCGHVCPGCRVWGSRAPCWAPGRGWPLGVSACQEGPNIALQLPPPPAEPQARPSVGQPFIRVASRRGQSE